MSVDVAIQDGPLAGWRSEAVADVGAVGAALVFEGIVRADEHGERIEALEYEAYQPMAERMLRALGEAMMARHGVKSVRVWHSRGRVRVGEVSFRLVIESAHRKEALAAMGEFIDQMKRDVPIWKLAAGATPRSPTSNAPAGQSLGT